MIARGEMRGRREVALAATRGGGRREENENPRFPTPRFFFFEWDAAFFFFLGETVIAEEIVHWAGPTLLSLFF